MVKMIQRDNCSRGIRFSLIVGRWCKLIPRVKHLRLLIGATLRSQLRWARQHIYYWLVLGPLVIGFTFMTIARVVNNLPPWQPSLATLFAVATLFELALIALNLSRASIEIYHLRRPEAYFDALPLATRTHWQAALITRLGRTTVVAFAGLIAHALTGGARMIEATNLLPFLLFIAVTSLAELFAALNWIHWGHTQAARASGVALLILFPIMALGGALLTAVIKPDIFSPPERLWLAVVAAFSCVALMAISDFLHQRWRAFDIEYVKRLQSTSRWKLFRAQTLARRFPPVVAAQLARDLQLTVRAFSSAVYVVAGIAALVIVGLIVAFTTNLLPVGNPSGGILDATWLPQVLAIKSACVVVTVVLAALVPTLVAYELPMMWVERATGIAGLDLCQAKLWYARVVTLPAPFVVWVAGMLVGHVPGAYGIGVLVECLFLWWMISSLIGLLAFEMPTRPGLAIIVLTNMGLAAGALAVMFWPVGLIIYVQVMHSLTERGRALARLHLMMEDD